MAELNSSSKIKGSRRTAMPRVDLTAMVDLAFLLITFFMLTTTLRKNNAMALSMPDKTDIIDNLPVPASRTYTLCLGRNNELVAYMGLPGKFIGEPVVTRYSKNGLRSLLISKQNDIKTHTGKDMILLIKPSDHSVYEDLVNSIDEANITKINKYAVVDIGPHDINLLKKYNLY